MRLHRIGQRDDSECLFMLTRESVNRLVVGGKYLPQVSSIL